MKILLGAFTRNTHTTQNDYSRVIKIWMCANTKRAWNLMQRIMNNDSPHDWVSRFETRVHTQNQLFRIPRMPGINFRGQKYLMVFNVGVKKLLIFWERRHSAFVLYCWEIKIVYGDSFSRRIFDGAFWSQSAVCAYTYSFEYITTNKILYWLK